MTHSYSNHFQRTPHEIRWLAGWILSHPMRTRLVDIRFSGTFSHITLLRLHCRRHSIQKIVCAGICFVVAKSTTKLSCICLMTRTIQVQ